MNGGDGYTAGGAGSSRAAALHSEAFAAGAEAALRNDQADAARCAAMLEAADTLAEGFASIAAALRVEARISTALGQPLHAEAVAEAARHAADYEAELQTIIREAMHDTGETMVALSLSAAFGGMRAILQDMRDGMRKDAATLRRDNIRRATADACRKRADAAQIMAAALADRCGAVSLAAAGGDYRAARALAEGSE